MSMMKEFKEFAMRGNVIDMAVGIVIGVAFGKVVSSFVKDVLTPPIGMLLGGVDFSKLSYILKEGADQVAAVTVDYGVFLQAIFDFIIIAFAIFLVIKGINRLKRPPAQEEEAPAPKPTRDQELLTEIRDLLKTRAA